MPLPRNKKLTPLLAGRTIQTSAQAEGLLNITFQDGSFMKIKTGGPGPSAEMLSGKVVKEVYQEGTELDLQFTDNSMAIIKLAEATSSVMLRDGQGEFEYSD